MTATTALVPMKELDPEQVSLVKRTVAAGATNDELALFFFDCQRRGVHPLDKLLHFTKRNGKYTPITSIDFLRTRAHDTGKCAGITDAAFVGEPRKPGFAASVTVRRVVEGIVAEFTATARWDEYKPQQNDFMWTRMPHTMLGKCAEALALRKAFPQELAGLYTGDEMAQAGKVDAAPNEVVNVTTGEIVEQPVAHVKPSDDESDRVRAFQRENPEGPPSTYAGLITGKPSRKVGRTTVFDFGVDDQTMSTTDELIARMVSDYIGQRAIVSYMHTPKGGLAIKSIAVDRIADESQTEPSW